MRWSTLATIQLTLGAVVKVGLSRPIPTGAHRLTVSLAAQPSPWWQRGNRQLVSSVQLADCWRRASWGAPRWAGHYLGERLRTERPGRHHVYVWNSTTGDFSEVTDGTHNLFCSGNAFLPDGRLLVPGGHIVDNAGLKYAQIFNWLTNSWGAGACRRERVVGTLPLLRSPTAPSQWLPARMKTPPQISTLRCGTALDGGCSPGRRLQ